MSGTQTLAVILVLYLALEVGAIALGATLGKRVGLLRRVTITCAALGLAYLALANWSTLVN